MIDDGKQPNNTAQSPTIEGSEEGGEDIQAANIDAHPLTVWEKETQNELFDFISFAAETKRSCQLAKNMVLSEGLSNLGIAIE